MEYLAIARKTNNIERRKIAEKRNIVKKAVDQL